MADRYVDTEYVENSIGGGYITAARGKCDLDTLIEQATALIQSYLRNNGYTTPSTTTDVTVKMAVIGALWEMLSSIPECKISLPENWNAHPVRVAYAGILNGDATLTLPLTTIQAVGGSSFTESRTGYPNALPPRASRSNLSGY